MIECREHPRVQIDLQVFFSMAGKPDIRQGTMFDLCVGGCAVTSAAPVDLGMEVKLSIRAIDLGSPITVDSGAIRWAHHGEFGVEFLALTEVDRHRLNRLLNVITPRPTRHT